MVAEEHREESKTNVLHASGNKEREAVEEIRQGKALPK